MAYSPVVPRSFWATRGAASPRRDVGVGQEGRPLGTAHTQVGQAHGGGQGEGDGKPGQTAQNEAPYTLQRLSCNRALPIGLIAENGSKVANNVDNAKNKASRGKECQITFISVAIWCFPARNEFVKSGSISKRIVWIIIRIVENFNNQHYNKDKNQGCVEI